MIPQYSLKTILHKLHEENIVQMNKIPKHVEFTIGEWKYKSYRMKTHVANTKILKQTILQVNQLHFLGGNLELSNF